MKTFPMYSLVLIIMLQNCLYKTFRSNVVVNWRASKQIALNFSVAISDQSETETNINKVYEIARITDETERKYLKIIDDLFKESNLFNDFSSPSTPNDKTLHFEFKHIIKRSNISLVNTLLATFTLIIYPLNAEEFHSIEMVVSDKKGMVFKNKRSEKSLLSFSILYVFLTNFYNNTTAKDRIFYEQSSLLLNDFYKVYTMEKHSK